MIDSLIPPPEFVMALASCLMLPVWLLVISFMKPQRMNAKHRLVAAIIVAPLSVVTVGFLGFSERVFSQPAAWVDLFCAGLLYGTAVMIVYCAWALIGFGFTVSVLMDVYLAGRPLTTDELVASMADGRGLVGFVRDRAGVLLRTHLVLSEGNKCRIAGPKALRFARIVGFAMDAYSINRREI